jgi:hypothetical protein
MIDPEMNVATSEVPEVVVLNPAVTSLLSHSKTQIVWGTGTLMANALMRVKEVGGESPN